MTNFNPSQPVFNSWTYTRKERRKIGNNFFHPRIFSTVSYAKDKFLFACAIIIETITLFIALFFSGFNIFYIVGASVLVIIDLWFASLLHNHQGNINKYNCKLELAKYDEKNAIGDIKSLRDSQNVYRASIDYYEAKKKKFVVILFIIAAIKAFFAYLVLLPFGMAVSFGIPILFFIAAYIHSFHTGYFLSEYRRLRDYNKERRLFLGSVAEEDNSSYKILQADYETFQEPIPQTILDELNSYIEGMSDELKKSRRINDRNEFDNNSNYILLFGDDDRQKVIFNSKTQKFLLSHWGEIEDEEFFNFVNGLPVSAALKSYIGYQGLKVQDSVYEQPKPALIKEKQ